MNSEDSAHVRDIATGYISDIADRMRNAIDVIGSEAIAYKLVPFRDGNQWCVLLGDDLQSGIAGFGDSPSLAIADFDRAMNTKIKATDTEGRKDEA